MTPIVLALVAAPIGAAVGAAVTWVLLRRRPAPVEPSVDERQFAQLIENLRPAAIVVDAGSRVIASSRTARTYGLVRRDSVAAPAVRGLLDRARRADEPIELEYEVLRGPDLPSRTLNLRAAAASGGVAVVVGEDRSADERFAETRRDFVANISHELKTPIGAITLLAEAVEAAADDPEAVRDFASRLSGETLRLTDLLTQVMALSRLQSDDPIGEPVAVDVAAVVERALTRCRERARRSQIALSVGGCDQAQVLGDPSGLEAAVTNLVENAIAYSDAGSAVTVTVRRVPDDQTVEIRVADHGIGIAEADQARVFERFFRVDPARSRASGGTGLGLSIVKHTALAHGGEVSVWSRPGLGSTFTISLPEHSGIDSGSDEGIP